MRPGRQRKHKAVVAITDAGLHQFGAESISQDFAGQLAVKVNAQQNRQIRVLGVLDPSRDLLVAERVHGSADGPVLLGHHPVKARVDDGEVALIVLAGDGEIELAPVGGCGKQFLAVRPKAGQRFDPAKPDIGVDDRLNSACHIGSIVALEPDRFWFESEPGSRFLFWRVFFTRTGDPFARKRYRTARLTFARQDSRRASR